jgi:hypothetical protein
MRNLWQFKKKYGGRISTAVVDVRKVIPSRPFVDEEKVLLYMKYDGEPKPIGVIEFDGNYYLVEGNRRSVANYKLGNFMVDAMILRDAHSKLGAVLSRRNNFSIENLADDLR